MRRIISAAALTVAVLGVVVAVATPAQASQIPCGNPNAVTVQLAITKICFQGIGRNQFNKIDVVSLDAGKYGGVVEIIGKPDRRFYPGDTIPFDPPVNPSYINLYTRIP